jgi:hypothetical protein
MTGVLAFLAIVVAIGISGCAISMAFGKNPTAKASTDFRSDSKITDPVVEYIDESQTESNVGVNKK